MLSCHTLFLEKPRLIASDADTSVAALDAEILRDWVKCCCLFTWEQLWNALSLFAMPVSVCPWLSETRFFFVDKQRFGPVSYEHGRKRYFFGGKVTLGSIVHMSCLIYEAIWSSEICGRIVTVFPIPVTHLAHQHWSRDGWGGCRMVVWRPREQEKANTGN